MVVEASLAEMVIEINSHHVRSGQEDADIKKVVAKEENEEAFAASILEGMQQRDLIFLLLQ